MPHEGNSRLQEADCPMIVGLWYATYSNIFTLLIVTFRHVFSSYVSCRDCSWFKINCRLTGAKGGLVAVVFKVLEHKLKPRNVFGMRTLASLLFNPIVFEHYRRLKCWFNLAIDCVVLQWTAWVNFWLSKFDVVLVLSKSSIYVPNQYSENLSRLSIASLPCLFLSVWCL